MGLPEILLIVACVGIVVSVVVCSIVVAASAVTTKTLNRKTSRKTRFNRLSFDTSNGNVKKIVCSKIEKSFVISD